ncbi:hypothetical protein D5E69_23090 (plasmid) [Rossellomorea marisflavi]|uniref:hypothetical protein n=1 Tax=Rossellomorea marisflavi TaxID=189381 RepID=UPI001316C1D1|nr:hypothetical protein [Rossellomorea marisflavi]QHA38722.1 hypothetical protein D5E69_23090 [Rossellomorea marisflavi]
MNTSISTFMSIAFTTIVLVALVLAIVFGALESKNDSHHKTLETHHQLQKH